MERPIRRSAETNALPTPYRTVASIDKLDRLEAIQRRSRNRRSLRNRGHKRPVLLGISPLLFPRQLLHRLCEVTSIQSFIVCDAFHLASRKRPVVTEDLNAFEGKHPGSVSRRGHGRVQAALEAKKCREVVHFRIFV